MAMRGIKPPEMATTSQEASRWLRQAPPCGPVPFQGRLARPDNPARRKYLHAAHDFMDAEAVSGSRYQSRLVMTSHSEIPFAKR